MKKSVISEIYLTSKFVEQDSWIKMIRKLSLYLGTFSVFQIYILCKDNKIHYFVRTDKNIPTVLSGAEEFMFSNKIISWNFSYEYGLPYLNHFNDSIVDLLDAEAIKNNRKILLCEVRIRSLPNDKINSSAYLYIKSKNIIYRRKLWKVIPSILFSVDFSKNKKYSYQAPPKILDFQKALSLLQSDSMQAVLEVPGFPYVSSNFYLSLANYSFDKHSLVVGSSGSGKSKFISLLISRLAMNLDYQLKYRVVVIDPHASLVDDLGGLQSCFVADFQSLEKSINLFSNDLENVVVAGDLLLSLFSSYMKDLYNSKLERMLRHCLLLLLYNQCFSFLNLRKVLLDIEFRQGLINKSVPDAIKSFFLTDFNEMKNKYYNESIAPIISFLDEMELISVFQTENSEALSLSEVIKKNFLTIFSLNRNVLGDDAVKTISGLVMQQLMTLIQKRSVDEHIIFVVDEVSVVENPILLKFLAEARKFGLSLVLAQQYFEQISEKLKDAVFANVTNYYLFRVSRNDALTLSNNIFMKLTYNDSLENRVSMLVGLADRECVVRVGNRGVLLPAFKAKTVDFVPISPKSVRKVSKPVPKSEINVSKTTKKFTIDSSVKLTEIMAKQSSSRRNLRGDKNE